MRKAPSYFPIVNLKKADVCREVQVAEFPVVEVREHVVGCRQKEESLNPNDVSMQFRSSPNHRDTKF